MELVPFNLIRNQRGNHVVDVGRTRDVRGEGFGSVIVPLAPPRGSLHRLPLHQATAECPLEVLRQLAKDHPSDAADHNRQTVGRVDEGSSIGLRATRPSVQRRAHVDVRSLERAQAHLTGGAQDRVIRARVQIHVFAPANGGLVHASSIARPLLIDRVASEGRS